MLICEPGLETDSTYFCLQGVSWKGWSPPSHLSKGGSSGGSPTLSPAHSTLSSSPCCIQATGRGIQGSRIPSRCLVLATALSYPLESQPPEQQGWEQGLVAGRNRRGRCPVQLHREPQGEPESKACSPRCFLPRKGDVVGREQL